MAGRDLCELLGKQRMGETCSNSNSSSWLAYNKAHAMAVLWQQQQQQLLHHG
jgi:hypothetical protein